MNEHNGGSVDRKKPAIKRRVIMWLVVVGLVAVIGIGIKFGRHHVFPKRFAVVEPGQLYRSGYLEKWPLERVVREHKLKTVLALMNDQPDKKRQQKEEETLRREGVNLIRIGMAGDGCADFELLERAAAMIDDPANRPLLVHCAAGVHRTGASYAVWRMKYCAWSYEKAIAEVERHGYNPRTKPRLSEHLRNYYETRIRPLSAPGR